jgi:hypothetical protein
MPDDPCLSSKCAGASHGRIIRPFPWHAPSGEGASKACQIDCSRTSAVLLDMPASRAWRGMPYASSVS